MTELWLKYIDETGAAKRVLVEREKFVLGRHSENDLSIADASLSRRHAQIERFGDIFILSDLNSSNGTTLNGARLTEPEALKKGDKFNLGGGFEFEVELISDDENANAGAGSVQNDSEGKDQAPAEEIPANGAFSASSSAASAGNSVSMGVFFLAPLLGVFVLLLVGGGIYLTSAGGSGDSARTGRARDANFVYSETPAPRTPRSSDEDDGGETPRQSVKTPVNPSPSPPSNTNASPTETVTPTPAAQNTSDFDKIERSVLSFARRAAVNDNNYVLSGAQLSEVSGRLKSFKNSDALRDNLKAVKQNSAQFEQMAGAKGLKPQFLAAAALARLGSQRGNPLQAAQAMLPVLGELKTRLGNELTDDNLLIIAAFDQGERGQYRQMQNTLEALSKQPGVDANRVRTIWFLRERGKLSDAQFDFALRFLAVGAISQNPKDFGVETEPVVFN